MDTLTLNVLIIVGLTAITAGAGTLAVLAFRRIVDRMDEKRGRT